MYWISTCTEEMEPVSGDSSTLVFGSTSALHAPLSTPAHSDRSVHVEYAAGGRRACTTTETVRSLRAMSSCSPWAGVARHTELTAVRVRRRSAVKRSCHLSCSLLKSKASSCALTRPINQRFIGTSKHTLLCSPGGRKQRPSRASPPIQRSTYFVKDGSPSWVRAVFDTSQTPL